MDPEHSPNNSVHSEVVRHDLISTQPHPLFFAIVGLIELRKSLRAEFSSNFPSAPAPIPEPTPAHSASSSSVTSLLADVQLLSSHNLHQLDQNSATAIYERTSTLLTQAAQAAQAILEDEYFSKRDTEGFTPDMVAVVSDAQAEILERFAPILADLCTAVLPSNPLSRDQSIVFGRAILEHNRVNLEQQQALPVFDRESAIGFCRTLPNQIFDAIGLEHAQHFVQQFSSLGGMLLSKSVYQAHKSWLFMESVASQKQAWNVLCSLFPRFAPDPSWGSFFDSLDPQDKELLAPLEKELRRAAAERIDELQAFQESDFHKSDGEMTTLLAIAMLVATDVAATRLQAWGVPGVVPLSSIPASTSSLGDLPQSMVTGLSEDAQWVVNRLAAHPQFPAVCLAFSYLDSFFQFFAEPYATIDEVVLSPNARQFLDGEFIRCLFSQVFDTAVADVLPAVSVETLVKDPLGWSLCTSLLAESPGALEARAALCEHFSRETGTLPEEYAAKLLQFAIAAHKSHPADESRLLLRPSVFNKQVIAPRPPILPSIYAPLTTNPCERVPELAPQILQRLSRLFDDAFSQMQAHELCLSSTLFNDFIILCVQYPANVAYTCSLADRLHAAVRVLNLSPDDRFELHASIAQLLTAVVHDAHLQNKNIEQALFPSTEDSGRTLVTIEQVISEIECCHTELRQQRLLATTNQITRSSAWWDSVSSGLREVGYADAAIRSFREDLHGRILPYMVSGSDSMLLNWSCLKPGLQRYPPIDQISDSLSQLLEGVSADADQGQFKDYSEFCNLMAGVEPSDWTRQLPITQVAAVFMKYVNSRSDRSWGTAPLQHMMASFRLLPQAQESAALEGSFASLLENDIQNLARKTEHVLCESNPQNISAESPIDILLLCLALGIDHAEFSSSRSACDILNDFSCSDSAGLRAPLASCWQPSSPISMPTIGRLKETITNPTLLSSIQNLAGEIESAMSFVNPLYGRLRPEPPAQLNQDSKGRFLAELLCSKRYFEKCRIITQTRHPRDKILRAVELLSEGLAGGLKDTIKSAEDPHVRAEIRERLGFDTLAHYIENEYQKHESAALRDTSVVSLSFAPTRGVLMEFAGYICDTCLTRAHNVTALYPHVVFIPFIKHTPDSDRSSIASFAGGSLVAEITVRDDSGAHKRALLVRGFNPSMALLKKVKTSVLFEHFIRYLSEIAAADGISTIVVPQDETWGIALTNRPFVFQFIKRKYFDSGAMSYSVASAEAANINDIPVCKVVAVWEGSTKS